MEYLLNQKSELLLFLSKQQGEFISKDSLNFFQDYQNLIDTLHQINDQDYNIFKFIYHFRNNIHALLYDFDETIKINEFRLNFDFAELYYLYLLINENEEIINYTLSFEILLNSYKNIIKIFEEKNKLRTIIIYKIVSCLIKNFSESDNYDQDINGEQIYIIKNEIETNFKNNIDEFKEMYNVNEEQIKEMKLNNIYCNILISLIKSNNFEDYNYLYNILNEMQLEKIDIGNDILNPLQETLKENNDYMKKFIIENEFDLYDEKKINFYFILFKFILNRKIQIYTRNICRFKILFRTK